ncbi:hypothetical protein BC834DRAFT_63032 [Gloeopeniophorella convolvens]|nr:hypothetical protein BC834DRAFT_63032 [Gloeopeniophorella convolvens]
MPPISTARALAPDLLLHIFRFATDAPGAFDADITDAFDHPTTEIAYMDGATELAALRETLATRRALVRVCRVWYALATPLLYRALWIGSSTALDVLTETLERRPELGAHALRLDVAMGVAHEHGAQHAMALLASIISHTPCLEVFVVTFLKTALLLKEFPHWRSEEILTALRDACGPSLRRLCWVGVDVLDDVKKDCQNRAKYRESVLSLFRSTSNLRTLIGFPIWGELELPNLTFGHLSLPLPVEGDPPIDHIQFQQIARFPSLRYAHLTYGPVLFQTTSSPTAAPEPRSPLTTAYIDSPKLFREAASTRVTKLLVFLHDWKWNHWNLCHPRHLPPTLTHLGINILWYDAARGYAEVIEWLHGCKDAAPELRVVRLATAPRSAILVERFRVGLVEFIDRGVRVEDARGEVLQPPAREHNPR